jgi:hypothetical protein
MAVSAGCRQVAFAVGIGGKADIGQVAENVEIDPERHLSRIICCGAQHSATGGGAW